MIDSIQRVLVVGAGWTGRQIAAQTAASGISTWIVDADPIAQARAFELTLEYVEEQIREGVWRLEQIDVVKQTLISVTADQIPSKMDLIIESVSEQSSVKRKVLKAYSEKFAPPTIVASNSSYFLPSQLSRYVNGPDRFAHLHFHVPVAYATLVDIVPGPHCDATIIQRLTDFAERIGQTALVQRVENPGYVFNWMLQSLLKSSLELLDREVATAEQIDLAWKTVTKMPLGPFGIIDRIGVDVVLQVLNNARWAQDDPSIERLIKLLEPLVAQGKLGWKSGAGFFEYKPTVKPNP